jgi:uncharacterized protein YndB with AHSA1/START domain
MMNKSRPRSITHGSFSIERVYEGATPARVFEAFAKLDVKERWFHGPAEWDKVPTTMDFRPGGHETRGGGPKGGVKHRFEGTYYDIVENERMVYAYEMYFDDVRISVSLATIELAPAGKHGTKLTMTEHGAFLDGYDDAGQREKGTKGLLEMLGAFLAH